MRNKICMYLAGFFVLAFLVSGCVRMKTYTVVKDRVDQKLSSGNQGYLMGSSSGSDMVSDRRPTRKTYVTEVEFYKKSKDKARDLNKESLVQETADESSDDEYGDMNEADDAYIPESSEITKAAVVKTYTVKKNDTLQKISFEVYGTTKKWNKIYEANKDKLKTPDKIYSGQILKIPQE